MGKTQDYFKEKATEQNNQLRIALISISVGLCAFFAKELNSSLTFSQYPYLYRTVISSLLASVLGLLAWKCSARMFYAMGQSKSKREKIWHGFKVFFDIVLAIILVLGVYTALMHLLYERTARVTGS